MASYLISSPTSIPENITEPLYSSCSQIILKVGGVYSFPVSPTQALRKRCYTMEVLC